MRLALFAAIALWPLVGAADEIVPATDRPQPKPPSESAACVRLPADLKLELVAAEPLVREPSAFCFDALGRLFVTEIHGYNLDGYLDIVELNKTGVLDREVRRVRHATPESQAKASLETYGTVRLLTDADGDGTMDASTVFADRLPPAYGVIAVRDGVIVVAAPEILFLADRDGDGAAEVRETLFSGFARELIERGMSNPRWGPDGWIYVAAGGGGGQITGPKLDKAVTIGHTDFRFRPDGSAIEPVTGTESMFGLTMNDFGDRFHTIITQVSPLDYRYLARNPFVASPAGDISLLDYRRIFPISRPDPWRLARGSDPAWIKFYGETETAPNGFFTATSGQMIYRAGYLPESYRGQYFVCDPANNLIHRCRLDRQGSAYVPRRVAGEEASEFLASSDQWFRPINLGVGPEGAIYVVDMYREIIEDFSAIPRFLQQQYAESLVAGKEHGRIWRIVRAESKPEPIAAVAAKLGGDSKTIAQELDSENHWRREQAQRLLSERQDVSAAGEIRRIAREGHEPAGRMHALYTLDSLGQLTAGDTFSALRDKSWGVRMHALRLGERWLERENAVLEGALAAASDSDPRVRLQAALSLGESRDARVLPALAQFAKQHGDERWMAAAIASSCAERAADLMAALETPPSAGTLALLPLLAETIGARRDEEQLARLIERLSNARSAPARSALFDGLERGLKGKRNDELGGERIVAAIERMIASDDPLIVQRAVRLAGLLKLERSPAMQAAWEKAAKVVLDPAAPLETRLESVSLLATARWEQASKLADLLTAQSPLELQVAAIAALAPFEREDVATILIDVWATLSPRGQEAAIDGLFARRERLPALLDAVEEGKLTAAGLGALRREQLVEHGDAKLRDRARKLLATRDDARAETLERYRPALEAERDPVRGAAVFARTCARCHKLGDIGHEVGPSLAAARSRPDATLLEDILDPSGAIAQGFIAYNLATEDGRVLTGLLASETATSISLRSAAPSTEDPRAPAAPTEQTVLRKDISEMRASSKSLMPDGLEKELSVQDVADLLGYLRSSLGPLVASGKVLFDDEQAFVDALTEGPAVALLDLSDKISGAVSLHLSAGQRHSPRIPGWEFAIVEKPTIGQFRYLRFSWKSAGAHGVMFELAADGNWPAADNPVRRYYAGKNTSGWAALEVASEAPSEWQTVTVDLWKDFGEFTLTGIAPTALGGEALFDRIELLDSPPH